MGPGLRLARYDPRVLRGRASLRYLGILAITAGCGASPPPVVTANRPEALPVTENQQGHAAAAELSAELEPPDVGPLPAEQPSIAGVYLWCAAPRGRACALATAALGTGPKDLSGIPPSLWTVEDRSNDCDDPTIATMTARLGSAFSVDTTGWRDQGGSYLDMSTIADMYQAAGCINDANPALPVAKISAADGVMPRVYLVRVWDGQAPTY